MGDEVARYSSHFKSILFCTSFVEIQFSRKSINPHEPCHEKTCLWDFQPGKTQTSLLSYRDKLES